MKSGLTPEAEKELQNCLQWVEHMHRRLSVSSIETDLTIFRLFDPIISQSVLSYSFSSVDDWKLEPWKKIFTSTSSMVIDDFIISLKEVSDPYKTQYCFFYQNNLVSFRFNLLLILFLDIRELCIFCHQVTERFEYLT